MRKLVAVLLLGAIAAAMPALASSETTPTVSATGGGYGTTTPLAWSPSQVTIGAGAAVSFANPSAEVPHGIIWIGAVKPVCSGVPLGEGNGQTRWSGSCTFAQAGTYEFECSVHHREMTGTITVSPAGTTTISTTGTTTTAPPPGSSATPPPGTAPKPTTVHRLTRAQKLDRALKACRKKAKGRRAACRRQARRRYGRLRASAAPAAS